MSKSPDAFRTISEVAEWLGIQAHVLRFWESKFTQVKPVKRAGGRRYYRPNDMLLLGGIKKLLYEDGLTIKGAQKVLREAGVNHVVAMSPPLDELTQSQVDADATLIAPIEENAEEERGVVVEFDQAATESVAAPEPPVPDTPAVPEEAAPTLEPPPAEAAAPDEDAPAPQPAPLVEEEATASVPPTEPEVTAPAPGAAPMPTEPEPQGEANLPAFLRRPTTEPELEPTAPESAAAPASVAQAPAPRDIGMPHITPLEAIQVAPGILSAALGTTQISADAAGQMRPLLDRLAALRAAMATAQGADAGTDVPR